MPDIEPTEAVQYLDQFIEATRRSTIAWQRANPTTFIWNVGPPQPSRVVLQRVDRVINARTPTGTMTQQKQTTYVLQVTDAAGIQQVSLTGDDHPDINRKLADLYQSITEMVSKRALDFLKKIIPSTSPK